MNDYKHTVLCVDDEVNILNSLKRLLRKESYRLLTASRPDEGLSLLKEHEVQLVMTDHRMPEMSGTDFLARVKKDHPEVIRIILTGYTEVDSITRSINMGNIYKFFLKPWNDENLKLEIKKALEQYDLIQTNKELHKKVVEQNQALKEANENLEHKVRARTKTLEIQNKALELSRAILEDLPLPIIGISAENMVVFINQNSQSLTFDGKNIELGKNHSEYFKDDLAKEIASVIASKHSATLAPYTIENNKYDVRITPLSGSFSGQGVIVAFNQM